MHPCGPCPTERCPFRLQVTEYAVFDFPAGGSMRLLEIAPDIDLDGLRACTAADFLVADDLREMRQ